MVLACLTCEPTFDGEMGGSVIQGLVSASCYTHKKTLVTPRHPSPPRCINWYRQQTTRGNPVIY